MSKEIPHVHSGLLLNPVLLYLQLGKLPFISYLFIVLTGPVLLWKSPENRWMAMEADPPEGSKVSKVVVNLPLSTDGQAQTLTSSPEAQQWSSSLVNKSYSFSQYSGPGYWVAFVIRLSPYHLVSELQKLLMIHSLWTACTQHSGLLGYMYICAKNSKLAHGCITLTVTESPTSPSWKGCIWLNNN